MKLSIKDRVIISNTVIPPFATRDVLKNLIIPIKSKIDLVGDETSDIKYTQKGDMTFVSYTENALIEREFCFTESELAFLKEQVSQLDAIGKFSVDTIETYEKILNE